MYLERCFFSDPEWMANTWKGSEECSLLTVFIIRGPSMSVRHWPQWMSRAARPLGSVDVV